MADDDPQRIVREGTGLSFTIDRHAVCFIGDAREDRTLATGFSFLRSEWIVTAKHVVLSQDRPRDLVVWPLDGRPLPSTVIYMHPDLDLAVLYCEGTPARTPSIPVMNAS